MKRKVILLSCLPVPAYAEGTGVLDTSIDYRDILLPVLLLLVASLLVIIGGLVVRLRRERGKLLANREYLVRYITYYVELKKQVPDAKEPYSFGPPEITPKEFIKVMDNMLRRIMYLSLFVLFALPLAAQDNAAQEATEVATSLPAKQNHNNNKLKDEKDENQVFNDCSRSHLARRLQQR